jgi:hypothetical protein
MEKNNNDNNTIVPTVHARMSHTAINQLIETKLLLSGKYCKNIWCYLSIGEYVYYSGIPMWVSFNCLSPAPLAIGLTYEVKSSFGQIVELFPHGQAAKERKTHLSRSVFLFITRIYQVGQHKSKCCQ